MTADPWDRGPSDPRRVFEILNSHGVDFTVIGGIAVIAHGHPRNTRNIDFVAATDRANLERLAAALHELSGLTIRIAGRDDLIRMKRAAGRPQDLDDIAALTDPGAA